MAELKNSSMSRRKGDGHLGDEVIGGVDLYETVCVVAAVLGFVFEYRIFNAHL